jgi:pterin-4a-carbinolamine dehydratase
MTNKPKLTDDDPIQLPELSAETNRIIINIRHITLVQSHMRRIAAELQRRALVHDLSKWTLDEFGGFVLLNEADKKYGYGSDKYKAALKAVNAVGLHTSRNSHHPEFHPEGVDGMGLFDLIEMICDWLAASEVYGTTSLEQSLQMSIERFGLDEKQALVVRLIVEALTA